MTHLPVWLPEILDLNGSWDDMLRTLYPIFERDFKNHTLKVGNAVVTCDWRILAGEVYEETFWHLVTRTDYSNNERLFDKRRAERLPWCAAILNNIHDPAVKIWRYREGNRRIRTYAWLEDGDYVVIMELRSQHRGEVAFLITAYHVDGDATRRSLRQKYQRREP